MKYADSLENIEFIETGLFIDRAINGIPKGRITEIFGDAGTGKSTLCEQIIASAQAQGLRCLFADVEWSYDAPYATKMGVDNKKLGLIREESAEQILDAVEQEVGKWDLIVLDSIGALTPRAELEKASGEKTIGAQAGLIARFCRKVVPKLAMTGTALIVINHSFTDIMSGKIMTSGGKKLDYHKSVSVRLKPKMNSVLKSGDTKVGKVIIAEVKKDKVSGNEGVESEGQFLFHLGFNKQADLLNDAIRKGIFRKEGNTFYYQENKLGTISKLREWIKDPENEALIKEALSN